MRKVQAGPVVGPVAQLVLLVSLSVTVGLGVTGWVVGIASAIGTDVALARGLARTGADGLGPANRVTLVRAGLVCGVAALVARATVASFTQSPTPSLVVVLLVALASVALTLDAVDGRVARRTGTVSALGARFDMEVDAYLILVLSVYVAPTAGAWVLAIGLARYALGAAGWVLPWLRRPVPARRWRKVVAAVQGIVLTVAASGLLADGWARTSLGVALALLAESFGHDVWWLWRHRGAPAPAAASRTPGSRKAVSGAATVLAGTAVWLALVLPDRLTALTPAAFVRIPVEGLAVAALALVLPAAARTVTAVVFGLALAALVGLRVLDMGFFAVLDRPFDPVYDWYYLRPAVGVLGDSVGRPSAAASVAGTLVVVVGLFLLLPLAVVRLTRVMSRHRRGSARALTALATAWVLAAAFGVQLAPGGGVASTSAAGQAVDEVGLVRAGLADRRAFEQALAVDPFGRTPGSRLLTGLRGKDVLLVFVESYGRVAVEDSIFSPRVDRVLDSGTRKLRAAGFTSRSAFLTSPTFGAASWLAHSTLQSGLWVDSQERYDHLLTRNRLTLTSAFGRAGWRTVLDVPADTQDWPQGASFYRPDQMYDARNVGYRGPAFSYATMPDQYTLSAFRRRELGSGHAPVMAEIDLVSSHHPWTPLPRLVDWHRVGDGSVFDPMPALGASPDTVFRDPDLVRAAYGRSIEYSLRSLVSFVRTYPDPDLVMVVLGDHQPHTYVTGPDVGHDVPISIVAHDPAVLQRIGGWHWQDGLRPTAGAPVWPMDSFRDRFLSAFGPTPAPASRAAD